MGQKIKTPINAVLRKENHRILIFWKTMCLLKFCKDFYRYPLNGWPNYLHILFSKTNSTRISTCFPLMLPILNFTLGHGLTLRGRTVQRNPWTFETLDSLQCFRYSNQHSHFYLVQINYHLFFQPNIERSPTETLTLITSVNLLVPFIFGAISLKQWAVTHSPKDCCF